MNQENAKTFTIDSKEVTTKEVIEIVAPSKKEKVILTVTKKHFFDPCKNKVVTDQTIHRARYRLGGKDDRERDKTGSRT